MSTTASAEPIGTGSYLLDPVHSTFGFAIKHNGVSTFRGRFDEVAVTLDDGVLTGTAQVTSVQTAVDDLKLHLLGPDFFDADQTPTIAFRSTDIRAAEAGRIEVDGELTIRGVTQTITATGVSARGENRRGDEVIGVELAATIDRRDYGLDYQAALPSGGDALGWDVGLEVHLELRKA